MTIEEFNKEAKGRKIILGAGGYWTVHPVLQKVVYVPKHHELTDNDVGNAHKMEERYDRLCKLAENMYDAAQYLTTDASHLRKACNEYRHFILFE